MEKIKHQAIVSAVKAEKITLTVENQNCSACALASFCAIKSTKKIELDYDKAQNFSINEKVTLNISPRMEKMGILLLYVLPTLIVFASLAAGQYLPFSENICALLALVAGGLYFLLLYLIRDRFKTDFEIVREDK